MEEALKLVKEAGLSRNDGSLSSTAKETAQRKWCSLLVDWLRATKPIDEQHNGVYIVRSDEGSRRRVEQVAWKSLSQNSFDSSIDWKESFFLTLITQMNCQVVAAACSGAQDKDNSLIARQAVSKRVFALPCKPALNRPAEPDSSFPYIYFAVDNSEGLFSNFIVRGEETFCLEVVVRLPPKDAFMKSRKVNIFQGAVHFDALQRTYLLKGAAKKNHNALSSVETIRMHGPQGRGHAEVEASLPNVPGLGK